MNVIAFHSGFIQPLFSLYAEYGFLGLLTFVVMFVVASAVLRKINPKSESHLFQCYVAAILLSFVAFWCFHRARAYEDDRIQMKAQQLLRDSEPRDRTGSIFSIPALDARRR